MDMSEKCSTSHFPTQVQSDDGIQQSLQNLVLRNLHFRAIKCAVELSTQETVCALMLDEMAIRRHIAWDGEKYRGFIDLGCGVDDDNSSL